MQVMILCGGFGSRLSEETDLRPKPMVEIGGKPILWHIMKSYSHHGFTEFVLCLGYKGDVIRDYFVNYFTRNSDVLVRLGTSEVDHLETLHDERDWAVLLAETGLTTESAGRVRTAARYLVGDRFMLTYGDGVSDVDIRQLVDFHIRSGKLATVTGIRPAARFGELTIEGSAVVDFREKPQVAQGWINGGFFVFERAALTYFDDGMLEHSTLVRLAHDGQLGVYRHEGYWRAMDTLRDKRALEEEWLSKSAAWKVW